VNIELKRAFANESGDYFQLGFDNEAEDDDGPYVLVQRQFEDPDGGVCYIETHNEDYIGHAQVARASISRRQLRIELRRRKHPLIEVSFELCDPDYEAVVRIARIMIPGIKVAESP
jgi:hypothetical protein